MYCQSEAEKSEVQGCGAVHWSYAGGECCWPISRRRKLTLLIAQEQGPWVGIEVDEMGKLDLQTLPNGSKDGIHYFHLGQPSSDDDQELESQSQSHRDTRQRRVDAVRERIGNARSRLRGQADLGGLGLGFPGRGGSARGAKRSLSPYMLNGGHGVPESPRALFVRPSEIVYVMGAAD
jgi:hypothetical protein